MVFGDLPPGYRFHPNDDELVSYYLARKVSGKPIRGDCIQELKLYECEPWELPDQCLLNDNEWYFFSCRDKKYTNGSRTNRATRGGYWKATGKDRPVKKHSGSVIGMKKTLVFYEGRAPSGKRTDWVMHEYRMSDNDKTANKDDYVLCRVYNKKVQKLPKLDESGSVSDEEPEKVPQGSEPDACTKTSGCILGQDMPLSTAEYLVKREESHSSHAGMGSGFGMGGWGMEGGQEAGMEGEHLGLDGGDRQRGSADDQWASDHSVCSDADLPHATSSPQQSRFQAFHQGTSPMQATSSSFRSLLGPSPGTSHFPLTVEDDDEIVKLLEAEGFVVGRSLEATIPTTGTKRTAGDNPSAQVMDMIASDSALGDLQKAELDKLSFECFGGLMSIAGADDLGQDLQAGDIDIVGDFLMPEALADAGSSDCQDIDNNFDNINNNNNIDIDSSRSWDKTENHKSPDQVNSITLDGLLSADIRMPSADVTAIQIRPRQVSVPDMAGVSVGFGLGAQRMRMAVPVRRAASSQAGLYALTAGTAGMEAGKPASAAEGTARLPAGKGALGSSAVVGGVDVEAVVDCNSGMIDKSAHFAGDSPSIAPIGTLQADGSTMADTLTHTHTQTLTPAHPSVQTAPGVSPGASPVACAATATGIGAAGLLTGELLGSTPADAAPADYFSPAPPPYDVSEMSDRESLGLAHGEAEADDAQSFPGASWHELYVGVEDSYMYSKQQAPASEAQYDVEDATLSVTQSVDLAHAGGRGGRLGIRKKGEHGGRKGRLSTGGSRRHQTHRHQNRQLHEGGTGDHSEAHTYTHTAGGEQAAAGCKESTIPHPPFSQRVDTHQFLTSGPGSLPPPAVTPGKADGEPMKEWNKFQGKEDSKEVQDTRGDAHHGMVEGIPVPHAPMPFFPPHHFHPPHPIGVSSPFPGHVTPGMPPPHILDQHTPHAHSPFPHTNGLHGSPHPGDAHPSMSPFPPPPPFHGHPFHPPHRPHPPHHPHHPHHHPHHHPPHHSFLSAPFMPQHAPPHHHPQPHFTSHYEDMHGPGGHQFHHTQHTSHGTPSKDFHNISMKEGGGGGGGGPLVPLAAPGLSANFNGKHFPQGHPHPKEVTAMDGSAEAGAQGKAAATAGAGRASGAAAGTGMPTVVSTGAAFAQDPASKRSLWMSPSLEKTEDEQGLTAEASRDVYSELSREVQHAVHQQGGGGDGGVGDGEHHQQQQSQQRFAPPFTLTSLPSTADGPHHRRDAHPPHQPSHQSPHGSHQQSRHGQSRGLEPSPIQPRSLDIPHIQSRGFDASLLRPPGFVGYQQQHQQQQQQQLLFQRKQQSKQAAVAGLSSVVASVRERMSKMAAAGAAAGTGTASGTVGVASGGTASLDPQIICAPEDASATTAVTGDAPPISMPEAAAAAGNGTGPSTKCASAVAADSTAHITGGSAMLTCTGTGSGGMAQVGGAPRTIAGMAPAAPDEGVTAAAGGGRGEGREAGGEAAGRRGLEQGAAGAGRAEGEAAEFLGAPGAGETAANVGHPAIDADDAVRGDGGVVPLEDTAQGGEARRGGEAEGEGEGEREGGAGRGAAGGARVYEAGADAGRGIGGGDGRNPAHGSASGSPSVAGNGRMASSSHAAQGAAAPMITPKLGVEAGATGFGSIKSLHIVNGYRVDTVTAAAQVTVVGMPVMAHQGVGGRNGGGEESGYGSCARVMLTPEWRAKQKKDGWRQNGVEHRVEHRNGEMRVHEHSHRRNHDHQLVRNGHHWESHDGREKQREHGEAEHNNHGLQKRVHEERHNSRGDGRGDGRVRAAKLRTREPAGEAPAAEAATGERGGMAGVSGVSGYGYAVQGSVRLHLAAVADAGTRLLPGLMPGIFSFLEKIPAGRVNAAQLPGGGGRSSFEIRRGGRRAGRVEEKTEESMGSNQSGLGERETGRRGEQDRKGKGKQQGLKDRNWREGECGEGGRRMRLLSAGDTEDTADSGVSRSEQQEETTLSQVSMSKGSPAHYRDVPWGALKTGDNTNALEALRSVVVSGGCGNTAALEGSKKRPRGLSRATLVALIVSFFLALFQVPC